MRTLRASLTGTVILALLGGAGGAVAAQEAAPTPALAVTSDLRYTEGGAELDVYVPSEPGPWPVVVIAHGYNQSRGMFTRLANAIAAEGAVVYNVDWFHYPYVPDATGRIACAVRFARATATEHGGDATRITYVGHSAGAALGMVVALASDEYGEDCLVTDEPALVDVLVGYEGPYAWTTPGVPQPFLSPDEDDPALWRAIDPYAHIGGNPDLVVRLVHGDAEDRAWYDVPLDWSVELEQVLRDAGYDSELTVVPDAGHSAIMAEGSDTAAVVMQKVAESAKAPAE